MILEVVRPDGARSWHRLDALPLHVGRALSNDLILDDPYVDARHARIGAGLDGALLVEDLGSVNGIRSGDATRDHSVVVRPGSELRVGRTTFRFRDRDEDVPPALFDIVDAPPKSTTPRALPAVPPTRWTATTPARLLLAASTAGAFALYTWTGASSRSSASEVLGAALGFLLLAAGWAGLWSIGARVVVHRFHFVAHLAVVSAVALAGLGCTILGEWLAFVFPDNKITAGFVSLLLFALVAALVARHLAFSSSMARRRRWGTGLAVAGVTFAIGLASSLAKEDTFSDVPKFSGVLKPMPAAWLPAESVTEFSGAARDLRRDVDELATKSD